MKAVSEDAAPRCTESLKIKNLMTNSANLIPPPEVNLIENFTLFNSIFAPDSHVIEDIRMNLKSLSLKTLMTRSANLIPTQEVDIIENSTYFNSEFAPDLQVIDIIQGKLCKLEASDSIETEERMKTNDLLALHECTNRLSFGNIDENHSKVPRELTYALCENVEHSLENKDTTYNRMMPSTSGVKQKTQIEFDLESSPESDPYSSDNDVQDPDFRIEESEQENETEQTHFSRKRQCNKENWRRSVIKKSRNSGKSYRNWKGKVQPIRSVKLSCQNCRMKCAEKITYDKRVVIFRDYWNLGDINRQRDFIAKYVQFKKKNRQRKRDDGNAEESSETSRRSFTYVYSLPVENDRVKVCKTFFINTLNISAQVVKTVFNKLGSAGVVMEDRRGKASKNNLLDESVKRSVKDHINSFETIESHYCRKNSSRLYLPATLNVSKMYALYMEYCIENSFSRPATESMYRHIFNNDFNLSFHHPKKDLCDTCHKYQNSSSEEKKDLELEYQNHIENKNIAREKKKFDKERAQSNSSICAAVFDLQQILPVPKSEVGLAYYKLKLSTFNFTVFNLATKDCHCYMWHESIAKRGSSEIGSCLLMFIQYHIAQGVIEFCFYSDNCAGQNRNKNLFSLYNHLSQKYNIIINHTYLERGHTQSEGDSVHSVIEKTSRNLPISTPDQWYTAVRTAKRKQPYIVHEISQDSVFDLKDLQLKTTLNHEKDDANEKVYWNNIKIVRTHPDHPDHIFFKNDYKQESFNTINLMKKGRKTMESSTKEYELKIMYSKPIPLKKKKYDHLQFLCNRGVIPKTYHDFFRLLPYSTKVQGSDDSDSE